MSESLRDVVQLALSAGSRTPQADAACYANCRAFFTELVRLSNQPNLLLAGLTLVLEYLNSAVPIDAATAKELLEFAKNCRNSKKATPAAELARVIVESIEAGAYEMVALPIDVPVYTPPVSLTCAAVPPQFSSMPAFRPAAATQRIKRAVALPQLGDKELAVVTQDMNRDLLVAHASVRHTPHIPLVIKDYVDQSRITVSEQMFSAQIFAMQDYKPDYVTNPAVLTASWVFIKVIMDAYVSRIPLMANFTFLREVSYAFVPTLRSFVASTFMCVRRHAYNLLASLASHVQLADSLDAFAGSVAAIEGEVAWLVRRMVEYQHLAVDHDERLWITALKCCLLTHRTDEQLSRVHPGALRSMLLIPSVSCCYPEAFTRLSRALMLNVTLAPAQTSPAEPSFHLGGLQGLVDLLALAPSVDAATSLCRTIATTAGLMHDPGAVQAFALVESLRVPWALHLIALGPISAAKDLGLLVQSDLESHHEAKKLLCPLVSRLTEIILQASSPPVSVRRSPVIDICSAAVAMIREDTDPELRRTGVRFASFAARSDWWDTQRRDASPVTAMLCSVMSAAKGSSRISVSSGQVLRRLCRFFAAAYPVNLRVQLSHVLHAALRSKLSVVNAMSLYRGLLESITVFARIDGMTSDISNMVLSGSLAVFHGVMDGGVDAVDPVSGETLNALWALYWSLRVVNDDATLAVRQARHVLIGLVACSEIPNPSWQWEGQSGVHLWYQVMRDPHPPCALIGAQVFNRVAAVEHYNCYEAVASDAANQDPSDDVLRNPFLLANRIYARITAQTA